MQSTELTPQSNPNEEPEHSPDLLDGSLDSMLLTDERREDRRRVEASSLMNCNLCVFTTPK